MDEKDVICEFLHANMSDPRGRLTSRTINMTGTGGSTYTLTGTNSDTVHAITALTVAGVSKTKWVDFNFDVRNQKIIFTTGNPSSGQAIVISTREGTAWIYPDAPLVSLSATSYPRLGVSISNSPGVRLGRYDADVEYAISFRVDVYSKEKQIFTVGSNTYSNERLAMYLATLVNSALTTSENSVYPVMYDFTPIAGPRDLPFDTERQAFRSMTEFILKTINIGEVF